MRGENVLVHRSPGPRGAGIERYPLRIGAASRQGTRDVFAESLSPRLEEARSHVEVGQVDRAEARRKPRGLCEVVEEVLHVHPGVPPICESDHGTGVGERLREIGVGPPLERRHPARSARDDHGERGTE